ncbi:MAG: hypothetical protein ACXW25_06620, partial [Rhodospirillales bacterium]
MHTADNRPPDPPAGSRERTPGNDAGVARVQELLETCYMADLGRVEPGWGRRQILFLSSVATGS